MDVKYRQRNVATPLGRDTTFQENGTDATKYRPRLTAKALSVKVTGRKVVACNSSAIADGQFFSSENGPINILAFAVSAMSDPMISRPYRYRYDAGRLE